MGGGTVLPPQSACLEVSGRWGTSEGTARETRAVEEKGAVLTSEGTKSLGHVKSSQADLYSIHGKINTMWTLAEVVLSQFFVMQLVCALWLSLFVVVWRGKAGLLACF